jgi:hypothetical protein
MRLVFQVAGGILLAGAVVLLVVAVGLYVPPGQGVTPVETTAATTAPPSAPTIAGYTQTIAAACRLTPRGVQADAVYADQLGRTLSTPPDDAAMYAWVATNLPRKPAWETCGQMFESFANPAYTPAPLPLLERQSDGAS